MKGILSKRRVFGKFFYFLYSLETFSGVWNIGLKLTNGHGKTINEYNDFVETFQGNRAKKDNVTILYQYNYDAYVAS